MKKPMKRRLMDVSGLHLGMIADQIGARPVGSAANQRATRYCAETLRSLGYPVDTPEFPCVHWEHQGAQCNCAGRSFPVFPSPYANGCKVSAPLHVAATLSELQVVECAGEVLLVRGELAQEQLMPKNFPFYNPEGHQLIIGLLEQKAPCAIITATGRNPELAGGAYPFPLIEDGDFDIPSVFTTEENGADLAGLAGKVVQLTSLASRIPSCACNVIARLGAYAQKKVVLCAHVDTKIGTPGALDNAAGVTTLLLAAELLRKCVLDFEVEFLVMNGEDYYGSNGEKHYLAQNEGALERIALFINLDALGYREGKTAFSLYNLSAEDLGRIQKALSNFAGIAEGEAWYQSDHGIFVMRGLPALAVTSEKLLKLMRDYTHTAKDVTALVDVDKLVETAEALAEIVQQMQPMPG